jgi:hypothetical protein
MSQEKQHLYPKRHRDPEPEASLSSTKPAESKQLDDLNVDEFLSKDAEEFLKKNKQKGGE